MGFLIIVLLIAIAAGVLYIKRKGKDSEPSTPAPIPFTPSPVVPPAPITPLSPPAPVVPAPVAPPVPVAPAPVVPPVVVVAPAPYAGPYCNLDGTWNPLGTFTQASAKRQREQNNTQTTRLPQWQEGSSKLTYDANSEYVKRTEAAGVDVANMVTSFNAATDEHARWTWGDNPNNQVLNVLLCTKFNSSSIAVLINKYNH